MWEPYLRTVLPATTQEDRARLETFAGGPLPSGYWEMAQAHQGEALEEDLVQDPTFAAFVLLLIVPAGRLGKSEASYAIDFCIEHTMTRYPAGLLPFADDTGGNLWAFDYRADPASPSIAFIDHELDGEAGVTAVAPNFSSLLARIGLTSR